MSEKEEVQRWFGEWNYANDNNFAWLKALFLLSLVFLFRFASASKVRMYYAKRRLDGKTVIVTGANAGIGKETARYLARLGARVIMACRNTALAEKVREEIVAETQNQNLIVLKLDLSSLQSVREFASLINRTETRLDILIHNAGYANSFTKAASVDGIEMTMATNHYGPFLLTHLLIDLLKRTGSARVVVVASSFYRLASVNLANLNPINVFPGYLYYVSKCANIMFTQELARRLQGTGVTANCLHPGVIDTGIWDSVPFPLSIPMALWKKVMKTPEQGCQTTVFCAVSEELDGASGKYYSDNREAKLASRLVDEKRNLVLWNESVKMVKLRDDDPKI